MENKPKLTGTCWCGCGEETVKYFASGHDLRAAQAVITVEYGSTAAFLEKHGYGPDGRNPTEARREHES